MAVSGSGFRDDTLSSLTRGYLYVIIVIVIGKLIYRRLLQPPLISF